MTYRIAEAESTAELERIVAEFISEGWRPLGGVSVLRWEYEDRKGYRDSAWWYVQAMVKDNAKASHNQN